MVQDVVDQDETTPRNKPRPAKNPKNQCYKEFDKTYGLPYLYNWQTKESSWERPGGAPELAF